MHVTNLLCNQTSQAHAHRQLCTLQCCIDMGGHEGTPPLDHGGWTQLYILYIYYIYYIYAISCNNEMAYAFEQGHSRSFGRSLT